jgi:hypothetical protein
MVGQSTDGGTNFSGSAPLPSLDLSPSPTDGNVGDPVMAYDPGYGGASGTIYLLANPSREGTTWLGFRLWTSTNKGATFSLVNQNVPGHASFSHADKPMLKVNNPGLLSDVLEGLLSMTDENWQERCEELAEVLRPVISAG